MPGFFRSPRALTAAFILLIAAVLIGLIAAFWDYTQDDVFITFVYSRHIAEGEGFVFNPGERVQGTTTPAWALLMAGVYRLTHDLLHAGNLLGGLFLALTIVQAVRMMHPHVTRPALGALALLLVSAPLVYISLGMETLFYCALLLFTLSAWARDRRVLAFAGAAAMTWTRADGLMMGVSLAIAVLFDWPALRPGLPGSPTSSARRAARDLAVLAAVYLIGIAPWFLFARAYFGNFLPQTFDAKQEFLGGTQFLQDGAQWWRTLYGLAAPDLLSLLAVPLILVGFGAAMRDRRLRALALWAFGYTLGYTALNVTAFWYYTPLFVALAMLAVLGGDRATGRILRALPDRPAPRRGTTAATLAVVGIVALAGIVRAWDYRNPPPRMATYTLAGAWIERHTDPAATLMLKDLGIVGYYARRYTLDSFGLIVPHMHETTDAYANAKYKTDYTLTTQYWEMKQLASAEWFRAHYVPVAGFATTDDIEFSPMTLFRRRLALAPPAQALQGDDLPLTCVLDLPEDAALPAETSARLMDASGAIMTQSAHPFLWGQYPARRTLGPETLVEQIALPLDVPPGVYRWVLDCDRTTEGEVEVLPITGAESYHPLAGAAWGNFARLAGIVLPEGAHTWSGGSLAVVLHWEASGPAAQDYSVFLHLADESGQVWAQADGSPRDNARPTSTWATGETIIDLRRLELPPNLPAGDYTLRVGWYDWRSEERVLLTGDAARAPDSAQAVAPAITVSNQWPGGSGLPRP